MIISRKKPNGDYLNDITDYLDNHLLDSECKIFKNYIYPFDINDKWLIRVPGATRGHIEVKNGIVVDIVIHEDSNCYKDSYKDGLQEFIGKEIKFD